MADDAHGSIAPQCALNLLLHKLPEGAKNEQSLTQLVTAVVRDNLGEEEVDTPSATRVHGKHPAPPVLCTGW